MSNIKSAATRRKQRITENNKEMDLSKLTSLYSESGIYPNIPNLIKENDGYYPSQIHKTYYVSDFNFEFFKDFEVIWRMLQDTELERANSEDFDYSADSIGGIIFSGDQTEYKVESMYGLPVGFSGSHYILQDGVCELLTNKLIYALVKNTKVDGILITNASIFYNLKNEDSVKSAAFITESLSKKKKGKEEKFQPKMNLVCASTYGFNKRPFNMKDDCKLSEELMKLHYGDGILEVQDKILNLLNKPDPALVLFSGEAGTGKTSFIRHLVSVLENQKFLYMPPNIANELGSPHFLPFMLQNPGEICVLEDAEMALMARDDGNHSSAISNLLGASDGLLGDALKLKFVCSFNTDLKNIDTALVRKGRLGHLQDFNKLSKENSDRLLEYLGKDRLGKELSLAEIYNQEENGFKKKEVKAVGFAFH